MEEVNKIPVSGIKDYIVNSRKTKFSDSIIIENLKKVNWPEDVILAALKEADSVVPAVQEEIKPQPLQPKEPQPEQKEANDLFTKPPEGVFPELTVQPKVDVKQRKKFSFL